MIYFLVLFLTLVLVACGSLLLLTRRRKGRSVEGWGARLRRWRLLRLLSQQKQFQILETETKNAWDIQENFLQEILRQFHDTEYGRKHHFKDMTDVSSFRKLHPLTNSSHYKDHIERISKGEENILAPGKPIALVATAGTSGIPTTVPVTANSAIQRFLQGTALGLELIYYHLPGALEKVVKFSCATTFRLSEGGSPVGPYPPAPSSKFLKHLYPPAPPVHATVSHNDLLYTQLLFALRDPDVSALEANFSWLLGNVFSLLETHWESLILDIQLGLLCPDLQLPGDTRRQIEEMLVPDSQRAAELQLQFERGFRGIAKRVWPKLQVIIAVGAGASELDAKILKDVTCQGIPLYSPMYCAAEGLIGVNLWPKNPAPRYVLCPRSVFFEFIPVGAKEDEKQETFLLKDVIEGEAYELVITNNDGFIRYRLGDVVRVTGFHNQCPIVEFLYRKSQTLSVRGECISEDDFYRTLCYTVSQWPGANLLNYCCAENGILGVLSGGSDPHYEVFLALKGVRDLSEEQRYKLDQALQEHFPVYKSFRFKGSIGPVRVHLVHPQSFFSLQCLASSISGAPLDCMQPSRTLRYRELAESIRKQVFS
ncbi:GH3 domain-containing protein [Bombina bombina]|uniref:GH3 domain-containing protein n=1 Tax=Bombina bombina TaxID=8345 RepID=UPI00235A74E7|nr:GH3 domain-containing protein [Bombina bombina]